eukprot:scaffold4.g4614.t1
MELGRLLLLASLGVDEPVDCAHPLAEAVESVQRGEYTAGLRAALAAAWPAAAADGAAPVPESVPDWFDALGRRLRCVGLHGEGAQGESQQQLQQEGRAAAAEAALLAAVAALLLFAQANLTGPPPAGLPECPFDLLAPGTDGAAAAEAPQRVFGVDSTSPADRWAAVQLAENGEELVGLVNYPQYLLLARAILMAPLRREAADAAAASSSGAGGAALDPSLPPAWAWWAARAALLQQRLLAARSAALRGAALAATAAAAAGVAAPVEAAGPGAARPSLEDRLLASACLLEAALMETSYGAVAAADAYLRRADAVLGFEAELAGALGVRTAHQREARAQLVLAVRRATAAAWSAAHAAGRLPGAGADGAALAAALAGDAAGGGGAAGGGAGGGEGEAAAQRLAELKGLEDESDVLLHPRLVEAESGGGAAEGGGVPAVEGSARALLPSDLHPLEQALVLGWAQHVRKGTVADALQPWEVAAYADAVSQQRQSQFLLLAAACLQACRLEKQRSRTRERAVLRLEALVACLGGAPAAASSPPVAERMRFALSTWFPLQVALRKELGETLVAMGLVGAALELFEKLELWDCLIVCYRLLDKRVQAEQLIRRRLEATPNDPRLWCALGDLTLDDQDYLRAWERSGGRSARAQRSLARNALRRGDHAAAAGHWEAALALNPLHAEGWFSLGYCCIKEKQYERALQAFTRSAQLEPENGEVWHNLAAIHMHLARWPQAFNALSGKGAAGARRGGAREASVAGAGSARQAVKHKRDSWQTWENYAQVAARVGQWQAAAHAVLALSEGKQLDLGVLSSLVDQVERSRGLGDPSAAAAGPAAAAAEAEGAAAAARGHAAPAAESAAAADAAADGGGEAEAALAAALGRLLAAAPERAAPAAGQGSDAQEVAAADVRAARVTEQAVGAALKQAAGSVGGQSVFWKVYARYLTGKRCVCLPPACCCALPAAACASTGQPEAATECLLKRVRALSGAGWQRDAAAFEEYASALLQLCRAYLKAAAAAGAAGGGGRDLSAARMHLRGLLKQAAERYEGQPLYARLQEQLEEVEAAQAEAEGRAAA